MGLNFIPSRQQMAKEVEQCVELMKAETLLSFCNSCIAKTYPPFFGHECQTCKVREGIYRISVRRRLANESALPEPTPAH